jgi:hypothetical protein
VECDLLFKSSNVTCQSRYKNKGPKPRKEEEEETSNMRFLHGRLKYMLHKIWEFWWNAKE